MALVGEAFLEITKRRFTTISTLLSDPDILEAFIDLTNSLDLMGSKEFYRNDPTLQLLRPLVRQNIITLEEQADAINLKIRKTKELQDFIYILKSMVEAFNTYPRILDLLLSISTSQLPLEKVIANYLSFVQTGCWVTKDLMEIEKLRTNNELINFFREFKGYLFKNTYDEAMIGELPNHQQMQSIRVNLGTLKEMSDAIES